MAFIIPDTNFSDEPLLSTFLGFSQGTFQNLNFEQAAPVFLQDGLATTASALPYWTEAVGGDQQEEVGVNAFSTGASAVSLVGPGSPVAPIDGNYSVYLQYLNPVQIPSISQTGIIPLGTQSLEFEAAKYSVGNSLVQVMIGSQQVPIAQIGSGPNYAVFGANISAWADQQETITFSAGAPSLPYLGSLWELDDITFSPNAVVSEPSPLALTGMGGLLFALYRRFKPKSP
jgi:hypothetical protein